MTIAVLGDLHGRVLLAFYLCARWQEEHAEEIDFILSVGDVGIYRSFRGMEKTSRRFAQRYPEELGFSRFFYDFDFSTGRIRRHPTADEILERIDANLYFVPGNHEEHPYLRMLHNEYASSPDQPVPADVDWPGVTAGRYGTDDFSGYARLHCLPEGRVVNLSGPNGALGLLAINGLERYTMREVWEARINGPVAIMLSHETYRGRPELRGARHGRPAPGSQRLLDTIRRVAPEVHLSGHHHRHLPVQSIRSDHDRITRSVGMNQVIFRPRDAPIAPGCFAILRITGAAGLECEIVEDRWFRELRESECTRFL